MVGSCRICGDGECDVDILYVGWLLLGDQYIELVEGLV